MCRSKTLGVAAINVAAFYLIPCAEQWISEHPLLYVHIVTVIVAVLRVVTRKAVHIA